MVLHGTKEMPAYRANGPRNYDKNYNYVGDEVRALSKSYNLFFLFKILIFRRRKFQQT